MAFRPSPSDPEFADLKGMLTQSKVTDNALEQTLNILIDRLDLIRANQADIVQNINNSVNDIHSIVNFTPNVQATYLTKADEVLALPNSVQLLAGVNVTFDDTVANKRTINSSGGSGGGPHHLTHEDGGADKVALDASQIVSGIIAQARLTTYRDFPELVPPNPAADIERLYALDVNGYTQLEMKDNLGRGARLASDNILIAKISEPGGMTRGQLAYIQGASGANPLISLARSDSLSTMPVVGLVLDTGALNAFTRVLLSGTIQGLDTSAFSEGIPLFVSPTVAGGMTSILPIAPNFAQRVGFVTRSHATQGEMLILTTGTVTDPRLHAPTHSRTGTDPVAVTSLTGYPGGTALFLREDGVFAPPPTGGIPSAHHVTHEVGGSDALVNAAWTNQQNIFTIRQHIRSTIPALELTDTVQGIDERAFFITNEAKSLALKSYKDDGTVIAGLNLYRNGDLRVEGNIISVKGLYATTNDGNVAVKDQPNIFTESQIIRKDNPIFVLTDTLQPSQQQRFILINKDALLHIAATDDGNGILSYAQLNRQGDFKVSGNITSLKGITASGDITEKLRSVPMGHWQDEPFNAANFTAATGTWTGITLSNNSYTLIGKTLIWAISISSSTLSANTNSVSITIPGGYTTPGAAGAFLVRAGFNYDVVAGSSASDYFIQVQDATHVVVHRGGSPIPAGTFAIYFTMTMSID